jgi:hypothetical protein
MDVTTIFRTKNVLAVHWLKDFATFFTWPWLYKYGSVAAAIAALRRTKALI